MSESIGAWLLQLSSDRQAAVGLNELVHLHSRSTQLYPVPGAPRHCRQLLIWEGQPTPVLDLAAWLAGDASDTARQVLAIIAYRRSVDDRPAFGGLLLEKVPRRIEVRDDQAVAPQALTPTWRQLAHAGFRADSAVVPILDLAAIFDRGPLPA